MPSSHERGACVRAGFPEARRELEGKERFLILPHPRVADYCAKNAPSHARWLQQVEALQSRFSAAGSR